MKTKTNHKSIIALTMLLLFISCYCFAKDYNINKVIEVGQSDLAPISSPLKWSPDGTKLAYFFNQSLYLSDTLGNSREITHFDLFAHRFEWLSDFEIVIHLQNYSSEPLFHKLIKVDINRIELSILRQFTRRRGVRLDNDLNSFMGPFLTVEGRLYYRTNVIRATILDSVKKREPRPIVFPESDYPTKLQNLASDKNHILSWGKDGLYMIKCDLSDSVRIAHKPYGYMPFPPTLSPDRSYYAQGGTILRVIDSTYIVMDTIVKQFPPNTGATDFMYVSFNPIESEVLFNLVFHDADNYEVHRVGTFDYVTNEFTIIDTLIGMEGCRSPAYAAGGKKIAFLHDGKVHILYREDIQ